MPVAEVEQIIRMALGLKESDSLKVVLATLDQALNKDWDRAAILDYARANQWDKRVAQLLQAFDRIIEGSAAQPELAVK